MAVNLSKEPLKKLPEYTPVHLIDEDETIVKSPVQESVPSQVSQNADKNLTDAMNKVLAEIETADNETQKMFQRKFLPAAKKANKSAQIRNCHTTSEAIRMSFPKLLAGAFCMAVTQKFSEQIAQFVISIYLAVLHVDFETAACADMLAILSLCLKVTGVIFGVAMLLSAIHNVMLGDEKYSAFFAKHFKKF